MKLLPVLKHYIIGLAVLVLVVFSHTAATAATVTYSTTCSFNGGAFSSPNAIVFGSIGNQISLTFTGVTNVTVNANLATFASLGQIQTATTGTGATISPGTTFAIRVTQTAPSGGTQDFSSATAFGVIRPNSTTGQITFSVTSMTINSITYGLVNPVVQLVPPDTNNGITTIQGLIYSTSFAGAAADERRPWPVDHSAGSVGVPPVERPESPLATGVTYTTTASFNGGAFSSPNAIVFGGMGNQLSITFTGVANASVTADPSTFISLGQLQTATTGTGATITPGTTFTIRITQTVPSGGIPITLSSTLTGVVGPNSSTSLATFTVTSGVTAGIPYILSSGFTALVPPSTNNGVISLQGQINPNLRRFDYDGDGKSDISVFRPSNGGWFLQRSTAGFLGLAFGISSDKIAPADYDGDGKTDVAVYRPSTGFWYIFNSSTSTVSFLNFGIAEDLPAPGDFDGDGRADLSVFRPSTGTWHRRNSSDGSFNAIQFGANGDRPIVGDFDGDGKSDIAVYRPPNGGWYRLNSSNGSFVGVQFGAAGDIMVPADYDGDGKTDVAVWRPSNGFWYIINSSNGSITFTGFGLSNDIPAAGDFDGDGRADLCVFRPSEGTWYRTNSSNGGFVAFPFGTNGDKPTQSAFSN